MAWGRDSGGADGKSALVFMGLLSERAPFFYLRPFAACGGLLCTGGVEHVARAGLAADGGSVPSAAGVGPVRRARWEIDPYTIIIDGGQSAGEQ